MTHNNIYKMSQALPIPHLPPQITSCATSCAMYPIPQHVTTRVRLWLETLETSDSLHPNPLEMAAPSPLVRYLLTPLSFLRAKAFPAGPNCEAVALRSTSCLPWRPLRIARSGRPLLTLPTIQRAASHTSSVLRVER